MVSIEKHENHFIFEIIGLHKLWVLKSSLTIPVAHVVKAYHSTKEMNRFFGLRLPGTQVPGLITAGTYLVDDGTIFCDITNHEKTIIVELEDEHYKRLMIDVENPDEAIAMLNKK